MSSNKCLLMGVFALLSFGLAIGAPPAVHPTTGEPLTIDCLTGTPDAIDGDLSDWDLESLPVAVLDTREQLAEGQASWDNPADCSGKFYLLRDDENIYIAVVVKDDKLSMNKTGVDIWNADCVEIFFSTTNAVGGHAEHYQYGFNANDQKWIWDDMEGPGGVAPDYMEVASSQTADGYICEVSIPHGEITPLDFSGGNTIGLHLVIDDTDNGDRELQMTWTGLAAHDQSQGFGHMFFVTFGSSGPIPADGSTLPARNDVPPNSYLILDYRPGPGAITNTAYFSDVEQDVIDRDPDHSLGSVPPWPLYSDTAFVVGYDDPGIPEYARAPLEGGKTYYWCVDTDDGTTVWPGDVWSFTILSEEAWGPSPYVGAEMVSTEGTMTWSLGDLDTTGLIVSYDVYIGTDQTAVADVATGDTASPLYAGNVDTESYDYAGLAGDTEIFWRVDTKLTLGRPPFTSTFVKGNVWSFTTLPAPPEVPITDVNMVGHWKLDGDVVEYWIFDSSGYGNHGVPEGDPRYVAGQFDNGLEFDGNDDYVDCGNGASLNVRNALTVACWFRVAAFTKTWETILAKGDNSYRISRGPGDGDATHFGLNGTSVGNFNGSTAITDDQWHHLAGVFDGSQAMIYIDGALDTAVAATGRIDSSSYPLYIAENSQATGRYFGGLLDDVRLYNRALSENEVRRLAGQAQASHPNPANGAGDVSRAPTLTWSPGIFAAAANGSVLYYSDDESAVINRTAPSVTLSTPSFSLPMTLDLGESFYWAVDTVNGVDTWPGELWSFTAVAWKSVDDMETYTPWTTPGNNIFEAWRDGEGNCAPGNGNDTGSVLTENMDAAFVLGGAQSMKYDFDNDGLVYSPCSMTLTSRPHKCSKIEAQTATLPSGIGSNWTVEGVKALRINFMGQFGNSTTDPLWVQLQDSSKAYGTKVFYGDYEGEDLADMNDPAWHQWDIDLADFNVDLTNVVSIVIGIGNEGSATAGGSGTIYVDDIRLYTPRCAPNRAKPAGDFDNSCEVDYPDVAVLFDNWLLQSAPEISLSGATSTDIGDSDVPGSLTDLGGGKYTVTGGGHDIWDAEDDFHYAFKPLSGDGQMTVRVTDIAGPSTNDWRKAGIMIRETLEQDSSHAFMAITAGGGGGSSFQWRSTLDGDNNNQDGPAGVETPQCIRLLRTGDEFRAFRHVGGEWVQHGNPVIVPMGQDVYIGLAVTSHDTATMCTATFDRVCNSNFVPMDLVEDGVVNFEDYADLLNSWLEEVLWPQ